MGDEVISKGHMLGGSLLMRSCPLRQNKRYSNATQSNRPSIHQVTWPCEHSLNRHRHKSLPTLTKQQVHPQTQRLPYFPVSCTEVAVMRPGRPSWSSSFQVSLHSWVLPTCSMNGHTDTRYVQAASHPLQVSANALSPRLQLLPRKSIAQWKYDL